LSIIDFKLFASKDFHSEYQLLDIKRYTSLTDKISLHYFELTKIPKSFKVNDKRFNLWLSLFKAKTDDDINKIKQLGVPFMKEAIQAFQSVAATEEFQECERMRELALFNEVTALADAERKATELTDAKWQGVIAEKNAELEGVIAAKNAELQGVIAAKNAELQGVVAEKDAEIERLRKKLTKI
jgi:hypothetical protein